jgi:hypothetical protein
LEVPVRTARFRGRPWQTAPPGSKPWHEVIGVVLEELLVDPRMRRLWQDYQLTADIDYFSVYRRRAHAAP